MCGDGIHLPAETNLSRRSFVFGAAASLVLLKRGAFAQDGPPRVRPRSEWAGELRPTGPLEAEAPEDVLFLLVHHTATTNDYAPGAVPDQLRAIYRFHTGERGWPDVAYNFFVDRFGGIWEGREGSAERPMKADATGGSQGHAVLACFLGDQRTVEPTDRAQASMVWLLAQLAGRYGIDPSPQMMVEFVSRGSNRWPEGTSVTTTTIAGHRDMSRTSCPGDAAYRLVQDDFPVRVSAAWSGASATPEPSPPSPEPTDSPTPEPAPPSPVAGRDPPVDRPGSVGPVIAGAGAAALAAAAAVGFRRRGREPG